LFGWKELRESVPYTIGKEHDSKRFLAILKKVEQVANRRNKLSNSLWFFHGGKPVTCFSWKSRKGDNESTPSLDEINKYESSILEIIFELMEFEKSDPLKNPLVSALEERMMRKDGKTDTGPGAKLMPKHQHTP
jgi:hypothetical protein